MEAAFIGTGLHASATFLTRRTRIQHAPSKYYTSRQVSSRSRLFMSSEAPIPEPTHDHNNSSPKCIHNHQHHHTQVAESESRIVVTDRSSTSKRQIVLVAMASPSRKSAKVTSKTDVTKTEQKQLTSTPRFRVDFESMGIVPYLFMAILFGAFIKFAKQFAMKKNEDIPASAVTSAEQEKELHVYKCGGCGYELWVARGREFKFFGDSFKCPVCGTGKDGFWDLNDPNDPRNQESEEEEEEKGEEAAKSEDDKEKKDEDKKQ